MCRQSPKQTKPTVDAQRGAGPAVILAVQAKPSLPRAPKIQVAGARTLHATGAGSEGEGVHASRRAPGKEGALSTHPCDGGSGRNPRKPARSAPSRLRMRARRVGFAAGVHHRRAAADENSRRACRTVTAAAVWSSFNLVRAGDPALDTSSGERETASGTAVMQDMAASRNRSAGTAPHAAGRRRRVVGDTAVFYATIGVPSRLSEPENGRHSRDCRPAERRLHGQRRCGPDWSPTSAPDRPPQRAIFNLAREYPAHSGAHARRDSADGVHPGSSGKNRGRSPHTVRGRYARISTAASEAGTARSSLRRR